MRVKLSYTVDEEDILKEASKILGLSSDDMAHAIQMFKTVQEELRSEDDIPNVARVIEMIEDFRKALLAVDTRLTEVEEIVKGYDQYRVQSRQTDGGDQTEYYGAD